MLIRSYSGWPARGTNLSFIAAILLACLISIHTPALAAALASGEIETLGTLENTLYSIQYEKELPEARLSRLETTVFGQAQSGQDPQQRLKRLNQAMSSQLEPLKRPNEAAAQTQAPAPQTVPPAKQPGESDYPVVSQMEQKVFGGTFVQEPLESRLTRLEKQVFKMEQRGELVDRTDNLRLMVLGDTGNGSASTASLPQKSYYVPGYNPPAYASMPVNTSGMGPTTHQQPSMPTQAGSITPQPYYSTFPTNPEQYQQVLSSQQANQPAYQPSPYPPQQADTAPYTSQAAGYPQTPSQQPYAGQGYPSAAVQQGQYYDNPGTQNSSPPTPDMEQALGEAEKQVLKATYPGEPFNSRLDRLENHIFHSTSPEMQSEERLQRVLAVAAADGSNPTPRNSPKSMVQTLLPVILTILPMLLL